jgi:dolichol-phosphate mannosyltransferase
MIDAIPWTSLGWAMLWAAQALCLLVLVTRLAPGRSRRPPVPPRLAPRDDTTVSVIVATLNEARRIGPCLEGLTQQPAPLLEVLVVDSRSSDGTPELVETYAQRDSRIRLITDDPLPAGWVGKVWALETGLHAARGAWMLGIDADTVPAPGLVGGVIDAAEAGQFDVVSFAPRFMGQTAAERLVQPAMLVTLVYRTGAAGAEQQPDRVLANGQCFLVRRSLLEQHGGYGVARASFSDDVTLARHLAAKGARVGFLDGSHIIEVRAYATLREMWREWGRSFDLKDSASRTQGWLDVALVWLVQALPFPLLVLLGAFFWSGAAGPADRHPQWLFIALMVVNSLAFLLRASMLWVLRGSYRDRGVTYWMSWLSDAAAAWRLTMSMARTPRSWRGRRYAPVSAPA